MTEILQPSETVEAPQFMTGCALATAVNSDPRRIQKKPDGYLITGRRRTAIFRISPEQVEEFKKSRREIFGK
jgi:hypothetical protein